MVIILKNGMKMSYGDSIKTAELEKQRREAKQGDFFFAEFYINNGDKRKSPVFIASNDYDDEDVIICSCTSQPLKTEYDKRVYLKYPTYVRTNKIYTIRRGQLLFKIPQTITPAELNEIKDSIKLIFNL